MQNNPAKITFYWVKDNTSKLELICAKAMASIEYEKRLLILVSSMEAGQYIDALLWRKPAEGFLPHLLTQESTQEWIAITMEQKNINQASCLLNLQTLAVPFYDQFEEIYELFDETSPEKAAQSQQRMADYQSRGLLINSVR